MKNTVCVIPILSTSVLCGYASAFSCGKNAIVTTNLNRHGRIDGMSSQQLKNSWRVQLSEQNINEGSIQSDRKLQTRNSISGFSFPKSVMQFIENVFSGLPSAAQKEKDMHTHKVGASKLTREYMDLKHKIIEDKIANVRDMIARTNSDGDKEVYKDSIKLIVESQKTFIVALRKHIAITASNEEKKILEDFVTSVVRGLETLVADFRKKITIASSTEEKIFFQEPMEVVVEALNAINR